MPKNIYETPGFILQEKPTIYQTGILGHWLLERTTPSWRIDDSEKGFQRVVSEKRARDIALAVLDQRRTFPNAIVLATDLTEFEMNNGNLYIPSKVKFMVVDGQHRLWAQKFSGFNANYGCIVHMGLDEVAMARLFLEINDNQKRVPSSLRWDLVRLVRPEDDLITMATADIVYLLATQKDSPLFQRVDLTGEQPGISLKQGSVAPGIRSALSQRSPLRDLSFEIRYDVILKYIVAMKEVDPNEWIQGESPFYKARVFRALMRLLSNLIDDIGQEPAKHEAMDYFHYLEKIDRNSLSDDQIRAVQGSAGIKAIYEVIRRQVFS